MKFEAKTQSGSQITKHAIELLSGKQDTVTSGQLGFVMDGVAGEVDWAEVEPGVYSLLAGGKSYVVSMRRKAEASSSLSNSGVYQVSIGAHLLEVELRDPRARRRSTSSTVHDGPLEVFAPMPGRIVKVLVQEDSEIAQGEGLLVIEAMKMQNEVRAPRAGLVGKIYVREGEGVES